MRRTKDYIDLARDLTETRTDYAVAKLLHLTPDAVSNYSHGRRVMNNETALRLSILLKLEFAELVQAAELERASDSRQRKILERLFKQARANAAALAITILAAPILLHGADAMAATRNSGQAALWGSGFGAEGKSAPSDYLTIMRQIGAWLGRLFPPPFRRARPAPG